MTGSLDDFCDTIRIRWGSPAAVAAGDLARDFVSHAGLSSYPSLVELHAVLLRYGVGEITAADLRAGKLKGHHFAYRDSEYTVIYDQGLWKGSVEHVMLHELYEIICETFQRKWPSRYTTPPVPRICWSARRFAAVALMQPEVLLNALTESGFDIVQLHYRFLKAYSSVAIRAAEVLNEQNGRGDHQGPDLMVAIYERMEEDNPKRWQACTRDKFQVRYAPRTRGFRLGTKGGIWLPKGRVRGPNYRAPCYPWHLIPKRGDPVVPDSLAHEVIRARQAVYLPRVTGFDLWGFNDLSFVAQPVHWFGKLAKVVLVGVKYEDRDLLGAQLKRLCPIIIKESYQRI